MTIFALLLFAHALADYPLQGDYLAQAKNRHTPAGAKGVWVHALASHAAIHGGFVGVITGSLSLGLAEAVAHALIDYAKCEGLINYHVDQALHVACKVAWVVVLATVGPLP